MKTQAILYRKLAIPFRERCASEPQPRRAIFGGTFNPIHCAHLEIAHCAQQQLQLAEIIWIPTVAPHYKTEVAAFEHRLAMVAGAIASYPQFTIASLPGRAIDSLTALQAQRPHSDWFWLIGLDAFKTLPRWAGRDKLAMSCRWLIAPRGDRAAQTQAEQVVEQLRSEGLILQWQLLERSPSPISASWVRQRVQANLSIANFVPASVQAYIQQHRLYRS